MSLRPKDLYYFFQLARPANLLIVIASFTLAAYLSFGGTAGFLSLSYYWVEMALMVLVTAGGYWVNDIFDRRIDLINKPKRTLVNTHISGKKVFTGYFALTLCVVICSFVFLPNLFTAINLAAIWLLYLYAQVFKRAAVIGNLIVALLTSLVIFTGGLLGNPYFLSLVWAMLFAFLSTFIREVAKDVEDMRGDLAFDLRTLPILVGIRTTKKVLAASLLSLMFAAHLPWVVNWVLWGKFLELYFWLNLGLVQLPLLYIFAQLLAAYRPADFGKISRLLKFVMVAGILCLLMLAKESSRWQSIGE